MSLNFYCKTLWPKTNLAFEMQRSKVLITDTKNVMKETLDSLEELEGLDGVLPFEVSERERW